MLALILGMAVAAASPPVKAAPGVLTSSGEVTTGVGGTSERTLSTLPEWTINSLSIFINGRAVLTFHPDGSVTSNVTNADEGARGIISALNPYLKQLMYNAYLHGKNGKPFEEKK